MNDTRREAGSSDADRVLPGAAIRRLRDVPYEAMLRLAAEIGPRGATSLAEAKAAAYLDGRLRRAGMHVSADPFGGVVTSGWDGLLLGLLGLLAAALYFWLPVPSLLLALWSVALAAFLLRRGSNPLIGRRRMSQNVIATRAASEAPRRRVVLLAPLDSPPVLGGLGRALLAGWVPARRLAACLLLALLALVGLPALPLELQRGLWYAQFLPAAYLLLIGALEIDAMRGPYSPGAVCHAGALAALLATAEELEGLEYVELWAVALGAATAGGGLADLLRRYPFDREATLFVSLEGIGTGSLCFLSGGDAPRGLTADPPLLEAAHVAGASPQIEAGPRVYRGGRTLAGTLRGRGLRSLAVTCLDAQGRMPLWASADDTPERVDSALLDRAAHLAAGIVRHFDAAR